MQVLGIVRPADEAATLAERVSDALAVCGRVAVVAATEARPTKTTRRPKPRLLASKY